MTTKFDLKQHEIIVEDIGRNLPAARLYEDAIRFDPEATRANSRPTG